MGVGIGRRCQSSAGRSGETGEGSRGGAGLWEVGRGIAGSRPTTLGLDEAET